jgi:hypothetical protein
MRYCRRAVASSTRAARGLHRAKLSCHWNDAPTTATLACAHFAQGGARSQHDLRLPARAALRQ